MTSGKKCKSSIKNKGRKKNKKLNFNILIYNIILVILVVALISILLYVSKPLQNINNKGTEMGELSLEQISPHYLFLGDSITEQFELSKYFAGYSVVNSGKDGNETQNILDNMNKRVYQYNPSTVFLMIGTNDIKSNKSIDYIFHNIKQIIKEIQENLPNTRIIVESILPSQENWGEYDKNEKRRTLNFLLYNEYRNSDVIYLDLYSMLQEDGKLKDEYTNDGLHLNEKSYELIATELKKYMIMKKN